MAENLLQLGAVFWDVIWQPALWLLIGTAASLIWARHRPARAHRILLLSMAAALLTPPLSLLVRSHDWGLLIRKTPTRDAAPSPEQQRALSGVNPLAHLLPQLLQQGPTTPAEPLDRVALSPTLVPALNPPEGPSIWPGLLILGLWAAVSGFMFLRFLVGFVRGLQILHMAEPVSSGRLLGALEQAVDKLGLKTAPVLYWSCLVRSPVIWCWGHRPRLLLPVVPIKPDAVDWVAVLCHELAHWKRRDHLACALGDLLTVLLPWQPLVWHARKRLGQLAERACDDWVLASGGCPVTYAESLLGMLPQRRLAFLGAVSGRSGLVARIKHILAPSGHNPIVGWAWSTPVVVLIIGLAVSIALVQERRVPAAELASEGEVAAGSRPFTLEGRVVDHDGEPVALAAVAVLPRSVFWTNPDQMVLFDPQHDVMGQGRTDHQGRFRVRCSIPTGTSPFEATVLASALGRGMSWALIDPQDANGLTVRLKPERVLRSRLLLSPGRPASHVRVALVGLQEKGVLPQDGVQLQELTARVPWWPEPVVTDADGGFDMPGLAEGQIATIQVSGEAIATQDIRLDKEAAAAAEEHTLAAARTIRGQVVGADTMAPLGRARITVYATDKSRKLRRHVCETFADEGGRFVVNPFPAASYRVVAEAIGGEPYHGLETQVSWQDAPTAQEVRLELPRGRLVHGIVRQSPGNAPVTDALVTYCPQYYDNPSLPASWQAFGFVGEDRHSVRTDAEGRFTLVALPGPGHLQVSSPNPHAISEHISCGEFLYGKPGGMRLYAPAWVKLDLEPSEASVEVHPTIQRGVTIRGRVVGADGKEVKRAMLWCRPGLPPYATASMGMFPVEVRDGRFEVPGCKPGISYRAMFYDPAHDMGAYVNLKSARPEEEPVLVRLEPCTKLTARFVNEKGEPLEGFMPRLRGVLIPGVPFDKKLFNTGEYCADVFPVGGTYAWKTDRDGRCTFSGLIPRANYWIMREDQKLLEFNLWAGQSLELPDIKVPEA